MEIPTAAAVWRMSDNIAVAASDGGARFAVLELDADQPVVLEESAAAIWRALSEPGTASQIAARVAAEYGVATEQVAPTIADFLDSLCGQGLATTDLSL
jgi:pyrroloquinoline quinone biosynthesis protein D